MLTLMTIGMIVVSVSVAIGFCCGIVVCALCDWPRPK